MSLIANLPDRLCEWFSDMNEFSGCSFCTQFPVNSKVTPLEAPVVVFGTNKLTVLDNTTDETGTIITDSRVAEVEFAVGIHVPRAQGGIGCNNLLDRICDLMLFNTSLSITGVTTEAIEYIRNTDSLYLKAILTTSETLVRGDKYPAGLVV